MEATCAECGTPFTAQRRSAKFCSSRCRVRDTRRRAATADPAPPTSTPPTTTEGDTSLLVAATIAELADAGRLGSVLGQQAVRLAERMGSAADTGSAIASLSRELRATMAAAVAGAGREADPVDEIGARRARKVAGA